MSMKTPQEWMEKLKAGKQHMVLVSRLDIAKIQDDARAELLYQIESLMRERSRNSDLLFPK